MRILLILMMFGMLTVTNAIAQRENQYSCAQVLAALQTKGLPGLVAWARQYRVTARERAAAWVCIRQARR
jgi:hypothetical protein